MFWTRVLWGSLLLAITRDAVALWHLFRLFRTASCLSSRSEEAQIRCCRLRARNENEGLCCPPSDPTRSNRVWRKSAIFQCAS